MSEALPPESSIVERKAGRVVLLDPDDRILLLLCGEPGRDDRWWITPGGGCEGEETFRAAARREAQEELGFDDLELGPCLWTRTHKFPWLGKRIRQSEQFYLCRTHHREPTTDTHTPEELLYLHGHRWWSIADIVAATQAGESFAPRRLGELLQSLASDGIANPPIDVGA